MDDPRFAELACLVQLEQEGPLVASFPKGVSPGGFGLGPEQLREMLAGFIEQDLVNGNATAMDDDRSAPDNSRNLASDARLADLNHLRFGRQVTLKINHKGRAHLHHLRDELRAYQGWEPFGILHDRRAWDRELRVQLALAATSEPLAVILLDLDKFKAVNDNLKHSAGDDVLKDFFQIVRDVVAERGYRVGGDEVGAVLPNTSLVEAKTMADEIRSLVEAKFKDHPYPVTASIGVASFSTRVERKTAYDFVDARMYEAKKAGGGNCVRVGAFSSPENRQVNER